MRTRGLFKLAAAGGLAMSLLVAMGSFSPASAGSTVSVGGYARCATLYGTIRAQSVTIRLDTGETRTVGTGMAPWNYARFDMNFSWMPKTGTGYTGSVSCPLGSRGGSWRGSLKPDWRNTTGTINYTARW